MRMVADHQISSVIYGKVSQRHLVLIRRIAQLYAPVKGADHDIRSLIFQ